MRIYDSRLCRFMSIDPIASKFPWNSTYAFCENSVIGFFELEGMEKISIHTGSFAPWSVFGIDGCGGYVGDGPNRQFGDAGSYRIHGSVQIDLVKGTDISTQAGSSTSTYVGFGTCTNAWPFNYPRSDESPSYTEVTDSYGAEGAWGIEFHVYGSNGASPALIPAPDIDVRVYCKATQLKPGETQFDGVVYGDRFPSNETYVQDAAGNKIILGVSGPSGPAATGPYDYVPGDNTRIMSVFHVIALTDNAGNFTGVKTTDGTVYTLQEWNSQFTNLDETDPCVGTNVQSTGVQTDYNPSVPGVCEDAAD